MAVEEPAPQWRRDSWEAEFGHPAPTRFLENWPRDKRLAVLLSFDTQADIDAARPNYQTTMRRDGSINFVDQMERQYEARAGLRRILRILDEYGVKATFPVCGMTAEWYPEVIGAVEEAGHEIANHSYSHWQMQRWTKDDERREIERAGTAIEKVTGHRPNGWRSPMYSTTGQTLDLLIEGGYRWDASFPNDDLPYRLERPGGSIIAIPSCMDDSNMYLMPVSSYTTHAGGNFYASPQHVLASWICEFDVLYKEAAREPRLCSITMHPRVSGRPFRSWALERFIEHAQQHEGVWFPTISEIADLC
jgi:peptidoglycan/xylan/chitin deacetylase (PgdA/CDA1 family)